MIRNERESDETRKRLAQAQARLDKYAEELAAEGLTPEQIHRALAASRVLLRQHEAELSMYNRLRDGDLSGFTTIEQFGQLLVGARIARGWSQRELALKLKIHESQVSRDERNDYHGVTFARALQILDILGVDVSIRPRMRNDHVEKSWIVFTHPPTFNGEGVITPSLPEGFMNFATPL